MAEFPSLPLFTDAYLADTMHLTTTEHGAYLLLLMASWRSPGCCLPDDDARLARYTKLTLDKWRKMRPTLEQFFRVRDGFWHQARLQDEFQHLQSRKQNASKAGLASAKAKALKRQHRDAASVDAKLQRNANENQTPIPTPNTLTKVSAAEAASDDPVKAIFDIGVALLTVGSRKATQARSIIGKWRKEQGDAATLAAIVAARDHGPSEPVEWINGRFRAVGEQEDASRALSRATAERYRQMDMPGPPPGFFAKH
ncbi:YdaU family protein [Sphingobium chungbukense]|uniref:YdaU family protein n=1 Tax=Sphingobium chungbukense TaxID=56193 RepID=UPI000699F24E|nr:DUF1376 domain-containing protein [Sphingobium chungbukense]